MPLPSRSFWVMIHRWAGLTLATFLIVAGVTGAVMPFTEELTLAARRDLSRVTPAPSKETLSLAEIVRRVEDRTGALVIFAPLQIPTDHVITLNMAAREDGADLPYDTLWANPYDGSIVLKFRYGVLSDGIQNIAPFLYELHYGFVFGDWGVFAFGLAALVWSLDCIVGFYLTLPVSRKSKKAGSPGKSWWQRWKPAWQVRSNARGHKLNFDLHRAGGLWLWPFLFVFAWSGFGFNLPALHGPIMRVLGAHASAEPDGSPSLVPRIAMSEAREIGALLTAEQARVVGFKIEREAYLYYEQSTGNYWFASRTSLDPSHDEAQTAVWFNGQTGKLIRLDKPVGDGAADAAMAWFNMLHMAEVFGLPYRMFVSAFGLLVVGLSVTGILIWSKKRAAQLFSESGKSRKPSSGNIARS
jgi:uncharacterized iron-regulated membrane protein